MPRLKHFFNPDFDHKHLTPTQKEDGSVDFYNIGYVQSVVSGQILAQWENDDNGEISSEYRSYPEKKFPKGPNTASNPENPEQLIATRNGYVFYNDNGLITVKELLNIRGNAGLNTGNIFFVGDMVVHGSIKSGLEIRAYNINVKGHIERAIVNAGGFLKCDGGIKGHGEAHIETKNSLRTKFCENATLVSGKNIIIDNSCMHSKIYCEGKLAVKGRLCGGPCYSNQYIYVEEQLGGGLSTPAQLIVGYSPLMLLQIDKISEQIETLTDQIADYSGKLPNGSSSAVEYKDKIDKCEVKRSYLKSKKKQLWNKLEQTARLDTCRVMVPGIVKVGVEISIGQAFLQVNEPLENVFFYYENHEIKVGSPALKK